LLASLNDNSCFVRLREVKQAMLADSTSDRVGEGPGASASAAVAAPAPSPQTAPIPQAAV
jgi:hypothetical protein